MTLNIRLYVDWSLLSNNNKPIINRIIIIDINIKKYLLYSSIYSIILIINVNIGGSTMIIWAVHS